MVKAIFSAALTLSFHVILTHCGTTTRSFDTEMAEQISSFEFVHLLSPVAANLPCQT